MLQSVQIVANGMKAAFMGAYINSLVNDILGGPLKAKVLQKELPGDLERAFYKDW